MGKRKQSSPIQKESLLELSSWNTAVGIANRRIFRIRCCGSLMYQKNVVSHRPDEKIPFGVSEITLGCYSCEHTIELELATGIPSKEEIVNHLEVERPRCL